MHELEESKKKVEEDEICAGDPVGTMLTAHQLVLSV